MSKSFTGACGGKGERSCPAGSDCDAGRCVACNSAGMMRLDLKDQFLGHPLLRCASCEHIQVAVLPDATQLQSYYVSGYSDTRANHLDSRYLGIMARRAEAQLDLCALWRPLSGLKLLDVGCGYGSLVAAASQRGAIAEGLEIDPRAAAHCRRLGLPVSSVESEGTLNEAIRQREPQLVVISHVLEHLTDPVGLLSACSRGMVMIEVPAYDLNFPEQFDDQEGHLNFFNLASLKSLLARLGFKPVVLDGFGPSMDMYWRPRNVWKRRLGRLLSRDHFMGRYSSRCTRGIWLRALARGGTCAS